MIKIKYYKNQKMILIFKITIFEICCIMIMTIESAHNKQTNQWQWNKK